MALASRISPDYGYVLLAAGGIAVQVAVIGFSYSSAARKKHGIKYPDMGAGKDAHKLSDEAHRDFNNHIRAHYNYIEVVASALALLGLSSIGFPRASAALGALFIVARQLYAMGYASGGASHPLRRAGAVGGDLALLGWTGMTFYTAAKIAGLF